MAAGAYRVGHSGRTDLLRRRSRLQEAPLRIDAVHLFVRLSVRLSALLFVAAFLLFVFYAALSERIKMYIKMRFFFKN